MRPCFDSRLSRPRPLASEFGHRSDALQLGPQESTLDQPSDRLLDTTFRESRAFCNFLQRHGDAGMSRRKSSTPQIEVNQEGTRLPVVTD